MLGGTLTLEDVREAQRRVNFFYAEAYKAQERARAARGETRDARVIDLKPGVDFHAVEESKALVTTK